MAMLPIDELVPQHTGGHRSSHPRSTSQGKPANGTGTMKRAQTMYWDEAALLNLQPQQRGQVSSQEVSSGSSGSKEKEKEKHTRDGSKGHEDGLKKSMSRMKLGADSRSGSDEAIPKSGSRFFLSGIGRKVSGK